MTPDRTRRLLCLIAVVAAAFALGPQAHAHPGEVDTRGGHICRLGEDCEGLDLGQYHCMQEPCAEEIERTARTWCTFGIPVPMHSDMTGAYPEGEFVPPIRVVRVPGPGHVLEVDRDLEPPIQPPQDCLAPTPGLELELQPSSVAAHLTARGPEIWGAAQPVANASSGIFGQDAPSTASGGVAAAVLVGLLGFAARAAARRSSPSYWEPHGSSP